MDQDELIARLAEGEALGDGVPERIDTHISVVFLTAARAYKLKRAIRTSYLDYRGLADRRRYCEAEIAINRRTAPQVYLRAAPVTLEADGGLALDGTGETVEWLVEMARFDADKTFDRLSAGGELTAPLIRDLADAVADFHAAADVIDTAGGVGIVAPTIETADGELRDHIGRPFAAAEIEALVAAQRAELDRRAALLDSRAADGRVRRCHGDLHLRNICLIGERPVIFDAIEFSDEFSNIDVLYDLAFLLMDLAHSGHVDHAGLALNRYLLRSGDYEGLPALPLFQSLRATIRAHVTARAAGMQSAEKETEALRGEAGAYVALAADMLETRPPRLVAIGGYSGTGKSTLARRIAPSFRPIPGAVILNSDPIRKKLFGKAPEAALPETAYGPEVDDRVFGTMFAEARTVLGTGFSVILDMTFRDPDLRARAERAAADAGVPFSGFWLEADPDILVARVRERRNDASDATADVLRRQLASETGEIAWARIDTGASLAESHDRVAAAVAALSDDPKP